MNISINQKHYTLNQSYDNLLECLRSLNISVDAPCSGLGTCGQCYVTIHQAKFTSDSDYKYLSQKQLDNGLRLSCHYPIYDGLSVSIHDYELPITTDVISVRGSNPLVTSRHIIPNFKNNISQSYQALLDLTKIPYPLLKEVDSYIAQNQPFYVLESDTVIHVSLEKLNVYGCAIDIGTTTVIMSFYNLETKKCLTRESFKNPQSSYGADVISRISNASNYTHLITAIQKVVQSKLHDFESEHDLISHMVVSGNTTMTQLFLGLSVESLGLYPFNFALSHTTTLPLSHLFDKQFGTMTILPSFSAFVGGDILAGVLGLKMIEQNEVSLLIDLGTNGELFLFDGETSYGTSTAAGPVFEGVSLACGMQAKPGAVYDITDELVTIGDCKPTGICGTGAISLLAWLYKHHHIDDTGRYVTGESYDFGDVYLTQGDIRALQTAKSAIRTGIEILMIEANIIATDIDKVYLAGGFANNIKIQALCDIELLPRELLNKVICVGNSSLSGAVSYLFDKTLNNTIETILNKTTIVSLSEHPEFQNNFMDYMYMKKPAD